MKASMTMKLGSAILTLLPFVACDCGDDLGNLAPAGVIEPVHFDFGPVTMGTECQAELNVINTGQSDYSVEKAEVIDSNGDFSILITPKEVALGRSEKLLVRYIAGSVAGTRESGTVQLTTTIPADNGRLYATLTGIPSESLAALANIGCATRDDETVEKPCSELDFGAVTVDESGAAIEDRLGLTMEVIVINEGTEALGIDLVAINQGSTEFGIMNYEYNGSTVTLSGEEAFKIPAGRAEDCSGLVEDGSNELTIKVKYSPTGLGADSDTLKILTDAVEGAELTVPLLGYGAKQGIVFSPEYLNLNASEGQTQEEAVLVSNMGSAEARINTSCIDLEGDGTCDGDCTGGDPVLGGSLSCDVVDAGKGFILSATDAAEGGDDEVTINVTWAPSAGNTTIPAGSVLRLESNILGNRVYELSLLGGVTGNLSYTTETTCDGFEGVCILANGTEEDTTTWTGSGTLTLTNPGDATVSISTVAWSSDTPDTTIDDFEILDGNIDILADGNSFDVAPGGIKVITVNYANNDFSTTDIGNLVLTHNGQNGSLTIPMAASFDAQ